MKIIITTPLFPPEIAEPAPYVKKVSQYLAKKHEPSILAYSNAPKNSLNSNIKSIAKNQATPLRLLSYFFKLLHITKNSDIIYAQSGISTSLSSVLVGMIRNKNVIYRFSEDESWERSKRLGLTSKNSLKDFLKSNPFNFKILFIKYLQTFVLKKSIIIITPSKYFKNIVSNYYKIPQEKIKVIYNPYPKGILFPFPLKKVPEQIIASGEFLSTSDLNNLIKSIPTLQKEFPDIKLKITGKINKEKFDEQQNIDFLGVTGKAEKYFLLKTSVLHIVNTSNENNPDILFTGFGTRTATICSNLSGLNEAFLNNQSGLFIKAGNKKDLLEKIRNIISNEQLRTKLNNGASSILEEKFSWKNHINNLENILYEKK